VCLVVDDAHRLTPGSSGAAWLAGFAAELPRNGHLLLAGTELAPELRALVDAELLTAEDLCWTADELPLLAAHHGVDLAVLQDADGDPARAAVLAHLSQLPPPATPPPAAPADRSGADAAEPPPVDPVEPSGADAAEPPPVDPVELSGSEPSGADAAESSGGDAAEPLGADDVERLGGEAVGPSGEPGGGGGVFELRRGLAVVVSALGVATRRVLATLVDLGGADPALLTAAVGSSGAADRLAGVPLVERGADGCLRAHDLWRDVPGLALPAAERAAVRERAVDHLAAEGRFDDAFALVRAARRWDLAPGVLRAACVALDPSEVDRIGRWLDAAPDTVRTSPAGHLATGLHQAYTEPFEAVDTLRRAAAEHRAGGDVAAELVAVGHLGRLAWWWQDAALLLELSRRVVELEQAGHRQAGALAAFGRALVADTGGDDDAVLAELGRIDPADLDPGWGALARWYEGLIRLYRGQPAATRIIVDGLATADPAMAYVVETLELMALWATGHVDAVLERTPAVAEAGRAFGVTYSLSLGLTTASLAYSHTGDVARARTLLEEGWAAAPPRPSGEPSVHLALAEASLLLAGGDEASAAATLTRAADAYGVDRGPDRRWWRQDLALSYVLVPEARAVWDGRELRGHLATARALAAAVVALRATGDPSHLRGLDLPSVGVARAALHHRFAAELAVGLAAVGRAEGHPLLDALGPPGRAEVAALAEPGPGSGAAWPSGAGRSSGAGRPSGAAWPSGAGRPSGAAWPSGAARELLAAVPAPPPQATYLAVLGPVALRHGGPDGDEVDVDVLHLRPRLHELLGLLVAQRRTTRAAILAVLWHDDHRPDGRASARELADHLDDLLRLLEPWRPRGAPGFLVRLDGNGVELAVGPYLRVDVDDFAAHVAAAARAESDGATAVALDHHRAAVALYRGDLHAGLRPALAVERDHHRARAAASARRAADLLAARGDEAAARALGERARELAPPGARDRQGLGSPPSWTGEAV
jgi:hypothetical protein